jgi:hypothetical protein
MAFQGCYLPGVGPCITIGSTSSINEAVEESSTRDKVLLITSSQILTDDLNIENRTIVMLPSAGSIAKASTYTITFGTGSRFICDPTWQAFDGFSEGDITFAQGVVEKIYAEWWGSNTTPGTTDMTTPITCAYTAGGVLTPVQLLGTTYLVSNLAIADAIVMKGMGYNLTSIKAAGSDAPISLTRTSAYGIVLEDFAINGNNLANYGIYASSDSVAVQGRFDRLKIINCTGTPGYGFATDVTNYSMLLNRCLITANNLGVYLPGVNQNSTLMDCLVYNNVEGQIHVINPVNVRLRGTEIENSATGGSDTINLRIQGTDNTTYNRTINLDSCYFESSREGTVDIKIDTGYVLASIDSMYGNGNSLANYSIELAADCSIAIRNSDLHDYLLGPINESAGIHNIVIENSYGGIWNGANSTPIQLQRNGLYEYDWAGTVEDEAYVAINPLISTSGGWGFAMVGDMEEYSWFTFTAAGVVTLLHNTANVVNSDTDDKFCIFDIGTYVQIRNRLGSSKTVKVKMNYL